MTKKKYAHIGRAVKKARLNAGVLQGELAKCLNYGKGQAISNIERGIAPMPLFKLNLTAETLGIDVKLLKRAIIKDFTEMVERGSRGKDV